MRPWLLWVGRKNRLPSEAEREYAARGGRNALFPWGDEPVDKARANYAGTGLKTTSRWVRTLPIRMAFRYGGKRLGVSCGRVETVSGGAAEKSGCGENRFSDGAGFLQVKTRRVIRGGSYDGAPVNLWVEYRDRHPADGSRDFVGFRCAN